MILCFEAEISFLVYWAQKKVFFKWVNDSLHQPGSDDDCSVLVCMEMWYAPISRLLAAGTTDSRSSVDIGKEIQEAPDSAYALLIQDVCLVDVVAGIVTLALQPITSSTEAKRIAGSSLLYNCIDSRALITPKHR